MSRDMLSTLLELAGLVLAAIGTGLVYLPAGVIIGGLGLFAVGYALGAPRLRAAA